MDGTKVSLDRNGAAGVEAGRKKTVTADPQLLRRWHQLRLRLEYIHRK
jgi:hypothetical protein